MKSIEFNVIGTPKPAGSKRGFAFHRKNGRLGVAITDTSGTPGREWRALVQDRARQALGDTPALEGPLRLSVTFWIARPKSHFNAKGIVRSSSSKTPWGKPDATKLVRAIEDALNGIAWRDDAQVVTQHVFKRYGAVAGATVRIAEEVEV